LTLVCEIPVQRLRILCCLLLLAVCFDAAASDLYSAINRLRAGQGNCAVADKLPPLKPQAALERVARDLSRGEKLQQSLKEIGYRATRSRTLSIRGEGVGAQAAGQRVLDLVNQARATPRYCGNRAFNAARPVRWNDSLAKASRLHAEDMARYNYFSHRGRDGSDPAQRVERAGYNYRATGENIAAGQPKPEDAVAGWIKSPPHCTNLMNPAFTEMGIAFAVDPRSELGVYWSQAFGTPR
jgi:uncharacterized protein YkwD